MCCSLLRQVFRPLLVSCVCLSKKGTEGGEQIECPSSFFSFLSVGCGTVRWGGVSEALAWSFDEGKWRKKAALRTTACFDASGRREHNQGTTTARHTHQLGHKCCRLACVHAPVSVVVERQSERWQKKEGSPLGTSRSSSSHSSPLSLRRPSMHAWKRNSFLTLRASAWAKE